VIRNKEREVAFRGFAVCIYVLLIAFVTILSRDDIIITLSHSVDGYFPPQLYFPYIILHTHTYTHTKHYKKKNRPSSIPPKSKKESSQSLKILINVTLPRSNPIPNSRKIWD